MSKSLSHSTSWSSSSLRVLVEIRNVPISEDTRHSSIWVSRVQKSAQPVNLLWLQELGSVSAGVSLPHPTSTRPLLLLWLHVPVCTSGMIQTNLSSNWTQHGFSSRKGWHLCFGGGTALKLLPHLRRINQVVTEASPHFHAWSQSTERRPRRHVSRPVLMLLPDLGCVSLLEPCKMRTALKFFHLLFFTHKTKLEEKWGERKRDG